MAPKRPSKRLTGAGAAKAAVEVEQGTLAATVTESVATDAYDFPPDPDDPRLTLAGLKLDGSGKVDIPEYDDLKVHFVGEPAPDRHPNPERPGMRRGEKVPTGLRMWDDVRAGNTHKDGAGWAAVRPKTQHEGKAEKWFNIRICGSWRLAFLLARLQRAHWDERAKWLSKPIASGNAASEVIPTGTASPTTTTPQKRNGETSAEASTARKAPRRLQQELEKEKPKQLIDVATVQGSERLQQILAARRKQQEQQIAVSGTTSNAAASA